MLFYKGLIMQQLTQTKALAIAVKSSLNSKQTKEAEIRAFLAKGESIVVKHEDYVAKYVTKANEDLYLLLADILAFAEDIFATNNADKIVKEMRTELTYRHKIKTQKNSTQLAIIVRFITRTSRKNALIYSQVLSNAISTNIKSTQLADYIKANGGINSIRDKANTALTTDNTKKLVHLKTYYARKLLEERASSSAYANFEIDKKRTSELHNAMRYSDLTYMVCKKDGLGKFTVIDAIAMNDELERKLLLQYYDFEAHALISHVGASNVESYLMEKFKEAIDADNAHRVKHGANLLDKFGYVIK